MKLAKEAKVKVNFESNVRISKVNVEHMNVACWFSNKHLVL